MATDIRQPQTQICPACGMFVETSEAEPLTRIACPKCGAKMRVERMFDHFVLIEILGAGGMGTVYKARDTLLDRFVALKLLRTDLGTGIDHAAQLEHEARVAASVRHPNVAQIFASGTDHGQFYLVMELIDYGSLDDLIEQRKRLPEAQVLATTIQVAKGLWAAHKKGLIHRDVKPANILFVDEYLVKISDFGLAGVAGETRGEIWATPYYVAPERLNNVPEDFRSDIYSLGATLFHALAGKAPIEGETNSATELRELKNRPLDLGSVAPEASPETVRVCNRMIAPNPADRFSSYGELVSELEAAKRAVKAAAKRAHQADVKLALKELKDAEHAQHAWRRRIVLGVSLLVLAALLAVGIVSLTNPTALSAAREGVYAMLKKFKTRSSRPAEGAAARAKDQKRIVDLETAAWNAALADYKRRLVEYDFDGAVATIKGVQLSDPSLRRAQQVTQKKVQWLADWKNNLIADLNRWHFSGPIADNDGAQYRGIAGANSERVMLKTHYGIVGLPWTKLPPNSLLAVSASFIWPDSPNAVDRQWLCAVFAGWSGQTETARQLAEAAAKAKPQYRDSISLLFSPAFPSG